MERGVEHYRLIHDLGGQGAYYLDHCDDHMKAEHWFGRALSLASQCKFDISQIRGLVGLARIKALQGNYSDGLWLAQQTHKSAVAAGNVREELNAIRWQATRYTYLGDFKSSIQLWVEGKELVARSGMEGENSRYTEARRIQEVILRQTSPVLSPARHGHALVNIVFLETVTGTSTDIVARNIDAAIAAFRNAQYSRGIFLCDYCHPDLQLRDGNAAGVRAEYIRLFGALQNSDNELACYCLGGLADPTKPVHSETETGRWAVVFLAFTLRPVFWRFFRHCGASEMSSPTRVALGGFTRMDCIRGGPNACGRLMISVCDTGEQHYRCSSERSEQTEEVERIEKRLQSLTAVQALRSGMIELNGV
ncbi:hypothetical protein B0H13DRAFT_1899839 [Mycena leptocephala]|nr:hypothetical protein B0H13DRAFT_1899839 [Mycena leptocephala]